MSKTVLITGTSSGIGKATALYFHQKGWNVAATMRSPEKEKELSQLDRVLCSKLDVTDVSSIKKCLQKNIQHFGKIDVVVNNAGYLLMGPFEGATKKQVQELFDVNVFGVMDVTREILPHFRESKGGCIINMSALAGRVGIPLGNFFSAAKWAIEGYSESLIYELDNVNIKIKIIEPSAIKSNFSKNAVIAKMDGVPSYKRLLEKRITNYDAKCDSFAEPVIVAQTIYEAATDNKNKFRYIVGRNTKLAFLLRRILPFHSFSGILKKQATK